jgi:hypothetical protein
LIPLTQTNPLFKLPIPLRKYRRSSANHAPSILIRLPRFVEEDKAFFIITIQYTIGDLICQLVVLGGPYVHDGSRPKVYRSDMSLGALNDMRLRAE